MNKNKSENIKVVVRIRPFLKNELSESFIKIIDNNNIHIWNLRNENEEFRYSFDDCLDGSQESVYDVIVPSISNVLKGQNSTVSSLFTNTDIYLRNNRRGKNIHYGRNSFGTGNRSPVNW
jgi:hypothetical protein